VNITDLYAQKAQSLLDKYEKKNPHLYRIVGSIDFCVVSVEEALESLFFIASREWDPDEGDIRTEASIQNLDKITNKEINSVMQALRELPYRFELPKYFQLELVTPNSRMAAIQVVHYVITKLIEENKILPWLYRPTKQEVNAQHN
jgi:hypothetical protein